MIQWLARCGRHSRPWAITAHETVVDRAAANPALHEAVIDRHSLPVDLLNEMYFMVEARLRDRILERNADVDPATLEAALSAGRKRMALEDGALPPDHAERNSRMATLVWLDHVAIPSGQIHAIPAEQGAEIASNNYAQINKGGKNG